MSNRVYLSCTDFLEFPLEDQFEEFFRLSGIEYEANSRIPIFWLCLFSPGDVKIALADHGEFEDGGAQSYAYLSCPKSDGLERLKFCAPILEKVLGDERVALYQEWVARVENEPFKNVLVRTEELDGMCEEGEFEHTLRQALVDLEQVRVQGEIQISAAMADIAGLSSESLLSEYESFVLVGAANASLRWPYRLIPEPIVEQAPLPTPPEKPWWKFW